LLSAKPAYAYTVGAESDLRNPEQFFIGKEVQGSEGIPMPD
jgi:hypothetical protein